MASNTNNDQCNTDVKQIQNTLQSLTTSNNDVNNQINQLSSDISNIQQQINPQIDDKKDIDNNIQPPTDNDQDISNLICRKIVKKFTSHSQKEGAGFIVHRPIGGWHMNETESDPFLMLDEIGPKIYKKNEFEGAPWHPHRGFDTVMYMKHGSGKHQDNMGNSGILNPGDVQWMTAGSGIIHDEGRDHPGGLLHGFQMWVNLPKTHKMCDPQYQQITAKNFPFIEIDIGIKIKVISGEIEYIKDGIKKIQKSPLKPIVAINYFDYYIEKGLRKHQHIIPKNKIKIFETAIIYVYEGNGSIKNGNQLVKVKRTDTIKFSSDGDYIEFSSSKDSNLGFLLLLGKPIKEPIAWRGPFVMNTQDEIIQCYSDYRNGKLATVKGKSFIY